jgi:polyhydroxybutyrate depolymerase
VKRAGGKRPFLLVLHGFTGSGAAIAKHLGLPALAEAEALSYAAPDGALDKSKRRHWNAGASCCDFDRLGTDHVAELGALIAAARALPEIDPARIYVAGFSNGGFMAERLACDVGGIAGVLDVAGGSPIDLDACKAPPVPVVIHVHGDADPTVRFGGGRVLGRTDVGPHPGAVDAVAAWAKRASCGTAAPAGTLDLEASIADAETTRSRHGGCAGRFEMLTVVGGGHDIAGSPTSFAQLVTILLGEGT